MKSLKVVLIATFFIAAMVSSANADGFKSRPQVISVININLEHAVEMPDLVSAIYEQINGRMFIGVLQYPYLAEVTHRKSIYRVSATRQQWIRFFARQKVEVNPFANRGHSSD